MRTGFVTTIAIGLLATAASAGRAADVFDTQGFEGYDLATVVGQSILGNAGPGPVWQGDSDGEAEPDVILDPTASGRGKVLRLDPLGLTTQTWTGAFLPLDDLVAKGHKTVGISWDQYRTTLNQAIFVNDTPEQESWFSFQYPLAFGGPRLYPNGIVSDPGFPLTAGVWQSVSLGLDFDTHLLWARLSDAQNPQGTRLDNIPFKGDEFSGINFEVYGTDLGIPNGPNFIDNVFVRGGEDEIPEPATALLLAAALPLLGLRRRAH